MFRFAHPEYLYLLAVIPVLVAGYALVLRRQRLNLRRLGNPELLRTLMVDPSTLRPVLKFALMMVALALVVFLIARPQYGTKQETVKHRGIEAIVAVDVSNSMLCEDVKPSRLDKAKRLVNKLIEQLDGDRMGLIAFAGTAVTLLPVTADNVSAKMFLEQVSPASVPLQGTHLAEAINRAAAGFSDNEAVGKALILITDAEDNEPGAIEAVKAAKGKGIRCFVLAVGTEAGGPIPMGGGNYKKDLNGQVVTTKLNPAIAQQIAKAGDGIYIHVDQTGNAQALLEKEIRTMQQADFQSTLYSEYNEQFIAVAILLLVVILLEACIMEKRNPMLARFTQGILGNKQRSTLALVLLMGGALSAGAQSSDRDFIRMGNRHFAQGQYHEAEICYQKAADKHPSMEAFYNLANSLVMQDMDSTADARFKDAAQCASPNRLKQAKIHHNMGDLYYASGLKQKRFGGQNAQQAFAGAVECFKQALRCNPADDQTRYNLAMAQWQLRNSQQQGGGGQDDQQDQQQDQQDQQQDQQDQQDNQQDQQQGQQDQQQNQQQQQQEEQGMDERTAEQLLNSAQRDEQHVQDKLQQATPARRSLEKDW